MRARARVDESINGLSLSVVMHSTGVVAAAAPPPPEGTDSCPRSMVQLTGDGKYCIALFGDDLRPPAVCFVWIGFRFVDFNDHRVPFVRHLLTMVWEPRKQNVVFFLPNGNVLWRSVSGFVVVANRKPIAAALTDRISWGSFLVCS